MNFKQVILISFLLVSFFSFGNKVNCDHVANSLALDLAGSNLEVVLPKAERLSQVSVNNIESTAQLNALLNEVKIIESYLDRKEMLIQQSSLIYYNVDKKCRNFDVLFNDMFMNYLIDLEFNYFLNISSGIEVSNMWTYKIAFQSGDIKETPYFKFTEYDDVVSYIEGSVNKIVNNEGEFRKAIAMKLSDKTKKLESEKSEINRLKKQIEEEEVLTRKLREATKEKNRLQLKLKEEKNKQNTNSYGELANTSLGNKSYSVNGDIDVSDSQLDALVTLIKLNGYKCDSVNFAHPFIYDVGFNVTCNDYRYSYEIEDVGGNWVVSVN